MDGPQNNDVREQTRSLLRDSKKSWGKWSKTMADVEKEKKDAEEKPDVNMGENSFPQKLKITREEQLCFGRFIEENYFVLCGPQKTGVEDLDNPDRREASIGDIKKTEDKENHSDGGTTVNEHDEYGEHNGNNSVLKQKRPGRPIKSAENKIQFVGLKLPPEYVQFLKNISHDKIFARPTKGSKASKVSTINGAKISSTHRSAGIGLKIRAIIDQFQKLKKREEQQLAIIKKFLNKIDGLLQEYLRQYERAQKIEQNEQIIVDFEKTIKDLMTVISILHLEVSDLQELLTEKEFKVFTFCLSWKSNQS